MPHSEIGGYLEAEPRMEFAAGEYYPGAEAFNTARNALACLLKARDIRKLYIPYLLCDSVSSVCERDGVLYQYYHTDALFQPVFEGSVQPGEALYIVNLYGQLDNEHIAACRDRYERIIADNTHAFFQHPVPGIDTVYSCRKFFGVPDGAYLLTDSPVAENLPEDCSEGRTAHLTGRVRDGASAHFEEFRSNEELLSTLPCAKMSVLTHGMLSAIDYESAKAQREENYAKLHALLGERNPLRLRLPEGPYAYPFYCENGMEIKKRLAAEKIYVSTLWPNVLELEGTFEQNYAENILPLPCDQRYGASEMDRLAAELVRCIR